MDSHKGKVAAALATILTVGFSALVMTFSVLMPFWRNGFFRPEHHPVAVLDTNFWLVLSILVLLTLIQGVVYRRALLSPGNKTAMVNLAVCFLIVVIIFLLSWVASNLIAVRPAGI